MTDALSHPKRKGEIASEGLICFNTVQIAATSFVMLCRSASEHISVQLIELASPFDREPYIRENGALWDCYQM